MLNYFSNDKTAREKWWSVLHWITIVLFSTLTLFYSALAESPANPMWIKLSLFTAMPTGLLCLFRYLFGFSKVEQTTLPFILAIEAMPLAGLMMWGLVESVIVEKAGFFRHLDPFDFVTPLWSMLGLFIIVRHGAGVIQQWRRARPVIRQ